MEAIEKNPRAFTKEETMEVLLEDMQLCNSIRERMCIEDVEKLNFGLHNGDVWTDDRED